MPRKKPKIKLESFGRYTKWERGSRQLPRILEFTNRVEAIEGNEFGLILKIEGGKGMKLDFIIKHPPFKDINGNIEPDFIGEYFVNSNSYEFYIGDCIWEPIDDKIGLWQIIVYYEGNQIASQSFDIIASK